VVATKPSQGDRNQLKDRRNGGNLLPNAYPVCMYSGLANETSTKSWLDYSSYLDAATAGAFDLLLNIRLLDNVMKLAVEG
jgi:hypothetical protein